MQKKHCSKTIFAPLFGNSFRNVKEWPEWQGVVFHTIATGISQPCLDVFGRTIDTCLNPLGLASRYPGPIHLCDLLSWLMTAIDGDGELTLLNMDFRLGCRFALDDGFYRHESQKDLCAMLNHHRLAYHLPPAATCQKVSTVLGFLSAGDGFAKLFRRCANMSRMELQNYLYQLAERTAPGPFDGDPEKLTPRDYQDLQDWVDRFFPARTSAATIRQWTQTPACHCLAPSA